MLSSALTVTELNEYTRRLMAGDPLLRDVEVTGEISGYKHHYSGHRYFSLKDSGARVQCAMFKSHAMSLDFVPQDGMKVTVRASASVFVRDGAYQLYVTQMKRTGLGDLYAEFERLKSKLQAEGLFDPARKRELPMLPKKIGLVTSETGAAVRDMIRVARRRNPDIEILLAPCAVQGQGAAKQIADAIRRLNENGECDVLLVGRGGGSVEDLWAFNEEIVARAIATSRIPVVSCVGHEVDFTIADFVADVRAATPSAAAEIAVPVISELRTDLTNMRTRLARALENGQRIRQSRLALISASMSLREPDRVLIDTRRIGIEALSARTANAVDRYMLNAVHKLEHVESMLQALSPENVLMRGYAIVEKDGYVCESSEKLRTGDAFSVRMRDGRIAATVVAKETE